MGEERKEEGTDIKELSQYVTAVIVGVQKGIIKGYQLKDSIDFELAVVKTKEASGGIHLFVADAGGKYSKDTISKIKFSVVRDLMVDASAVRSIFG